jgi:hypothetical protein
MKAALLAVLLMVPFAHAQDVIFLRNGDRRAGRVTAEGDIIRLKVPLPTPPGAPPAFASVSVPKSQVTQIEFGENPTREEFLATATPAQIPQAAALWESERTWLDFPKSPSARIGRAYADLLVRAGGVPNAESAFGIFSLIEAKAWSDADRAAARRGRLRAMVAGGRAADAVDEAAKLAAETDDPEVLVEAKFILAESAAASLKRLLDDNPRWQEDPEVIPERARLCNEALDLYLYPALFGGSSAAAARGLWGAAGVYQLVGDPQNALECARDITALHPRSEFAAPAAALLAAAPAPAIQPKPTPEPQADKPPESEKKDPPKKSSKPKKKSHAPKKSKSP